MKRFIPLSLLLAVFFLVACQQDNAPSTVATPVVEESAAPLAANESATDSINEAIEYPPSPFDNQATRNARSSVNRDLFPPGD